MTTSPALRQTPRFRSPVASELIAEWDRLQYSGLHLQQVRNWQIEELSGPFDNLDEVLGALGRFGDATDDVADRRLADLVKLAATDEFAATVIMHRILPALVSVARRRGGDVVGHQKRAFCELLPHAWIVIRTYNIHRRPRHVAAGLVRDIEYQTFVRERRLRSARELSVDHETMEQTPVGLRGMRSNDEHPMDTVVALIDEARSRGVAEDDLRFAFAWAAGADSRSLAETFKISDRMVRYRRCAVASRLRQALGADAA